MRGTTDIRSLLLLIAAWICGGAQAAISADCEFPIGSGEIPVRALDLNETVYACMRSSNYEDLKILNGDGNPVPLWVTHPSSRQQAVDYRKTLRFNVDEVDNSDRYFRHLRNLVRTISYPKNSPGYDLWYQQNVYPVSIIVENPDTDGELNMINVGFEHQGSGSVSATVYLEYSDDLSRWIASSRPQKLFFLEAQNNGFGRRFVELGANRRARYIRIVALSNSDRFVESITGLEGVYQRTEFIDPEYSWTEATVVQQLNNGQDWQFSVPKQLPVSRLRFQPANDIVYYSGQLMSKPIENEVPEDNAYFGSAKSKKDKVKKALKRIVGGPRRSFESMNSGWKIATRFQQFHFADDGNAVATPEPIFFRHQASRHWRIIFDHPSAAMIESHFPLVEFGWTPARVRFLAQGPAPFVLVAGTNGNLQRPDTPEILYSRSAAVEQVALLPMPADAAARVDTDRQQADIDDASSPLTARTTIWIVLVIGVLVMAYMAWQLIRGIDAEARKQD